MSLHVDDDSSSCDEEVVSLSDPIEITESEDSEELEGVIHVERDDLQDNLINVKKYESPKFSRPPQMTESQFNKLESAVSGVEEIVNRRDNLTNTQFQRLKVHLGNLEELRRTLVQMVENYLDDEEVSENLFVLLDYINRGISLQSEEEKEDGGILEDYRNALALSQVVFPEDEEAIAADAEFARMLQLEFEAEAIGVQAVENLPNFVEAKKEEEEEEEVEPWDAVPPHIRQMEAKSLQVNPFETPEASVESNLLQHVFTSTTVEFQTWQGEQLSSIQYVELTITKKYKSYKEPFVLALWEDCDESKLEFSYELLARLCPFSVAVISNPLNLQGSIQGEGIETGDVVGIGMIPFSVNEFIVFGTKNGKWIGHFMYTGWVKAGANPIAFHKVYRLLLLTGSAFKVPQLEVTINDGKDLEKPFVFDLNLPMEDCVICYDDVLSYCMTEIENCKHRFCSTCVKGYLEAALEDGKVLNTTCPDMTCDIELSDKQLLDSLGVLKYGKFRQYRVLATLRLEPDCRWCPKEDCENGVIGDKNDPKFPELVCDCGTSFCFHCSDVWHPGMTCSQHERQKKKLESRREQRRKKKEEKETNKWMQKNKTIKCAKCSALVQRKDGCNHMTCACGYEFCWLCGEKIMTAVGSSSYPLHYKTGACAGKQFSNSDELSVPRKVVRHAIAPVRFGLTLPLRPIQAIYDHY